jgi:hypothetical protein
VSLTSGRGPLRRANITQHTSNFAHAEATSPDAQSVIRVRRRVAQTIGPPVGRRSGRRSGNCDAVGLSCPILATGAGIERRLGCANAEVGAASTAAGERASSVDTRPRFREAADYAPNIAICSRGASSSPSFRRSARLLK